ncbi:MAG: TonB-dependent siderophore receptor [Methylococcaceae bacterium]|nr:TonB-dependent siderophore receptor [Methylococcaceae bacterium]
MMNLSAKLNHAFVKRKSVNRILFALMLGSSGVLQAGEAGSFKVNLPAQSLANTLKSLSQSSDTQLLYADNVVKGLKSKPLQGDYTLKQALSEVLADNGLAYEKVGNSLITVKKVDTSISKAAASADVQNLSTITVIGDNPDSYSVGSASTATKTDTPIMETPVSIQVVPRAVMDDQQVIRLEDISRNVSGVLPGSSDGNFYDAFIVRGFDLNNNVYRNGFRIPAWQNETAHLENVEVLKGAAAMLYGRIDPGGMVNMVTKKPLDTPYYSLQQQIGSYDYYRTTLDATGPVPGVDSLLYRFNLAYQNKESFRDFIESEYIFVSPSLTWNLSEDTQFNVNMEYRHDNSSDDYGIPAVGNRPASVPISRNFGESETNQESDAWMVEFTGSHAFNDDWKIKGGVNATSIDYLWEDVDYSDGLFPDSSGNPDRILERGVWFGPSNRESQGVHLDLTGHFNTFGMEHSILIGGDYYAFQSEFEIFTNGFAPIGCPIDILNPSYGCVDFNNIRNLTQTAPDWNSRSEEQWFGFYFQDQITLWDSLHILGGGRYDWASSASGFSDTSLADANLTKIRNERFSPRVGVLYQPWEWLSIYANYTESLGSANGLSEDGQPFAPQIASQYETGIKFDWEGISSSLAFYHLTKDNILGTDPETGLSTLIGEQRSQGIEFDISGNITEQLSMVATYAFTDARFTKSSFSGAEGARVPSVPEHQGSIWAKYKVTEQFSIGTGAIMVSQREGDPRASFQLPGYVRWDAMAAYKIKIGETNLTAQVNVNNILDKTYYESGQTWTRLRIPAGEPLSVLGSLRLEF